MREVVIGVCVFNKKSLKFKWRVMQRAAWSTQCTREEYVVWGKWVHRCLHSRLYRKSLVAAKSLEKPPRTPRSRKHQYFISTYPLSVGAVTLSFSVLTQEGKGPLH